MTSWLERTAPAKLNLALVVGPLRDDGKHEVVTVLQRITLADTVAVRAASATDVAGFDADTIVRAALEAVTSASADDTRFEARIEKRIPVAAGLGGGSSDAAAALLLANELLDEPLAPETLHRIASSLGSDVPFFLEDGAHVATGDGTTLAPVELPLDYAVLLALLHGATKESTASVYAAFDARDGERGFGDRVAELQAALERVTTASSLGALPPNDLAASPLAAELGEHGAFRADVTGAGPVVYGLFPTAAAAQDAATALADRAACWIAQPC